MTGPVTRVGSLKGEKRGVGMKDRGKSDLPRGEIDLC